MENESTNRLSQAHIAELEERLGSTNLSINKTVVSKSPQDIVNNHEQIQSKDSISYLHQLNKNNFTFLPRDRGPNIELNTRNDENILRSIDSDMCTIHEICKDTCTNDIKKSLDTNTNLQICNSNEVSADQKFLHKQISAEDIINENRKYNKLLNDDENQLYIELSDSGILKFEESRYCNNADSVGMNLGHTIKSQPSTVANDASIYTSVGMQNHQDNLLQSEDNLENFSNLSNMVLNNEEPMLRLVQTDTGEQFYEFIMNNLVEKMQIASCIKELESKVEEPSNTFRYCPKMELSPKQSDEKHDQSNQIEHQETLESLTDINNEFNYSQLDFHEEKNFTALCHDESENFQQDSKDNIQEKSMQVYNAANLELLENESHVDFDKYVETNLEALDKLNYENCNEKFLEFVEVADIGIESTGFKESSMIRLIQSDGEQLLELLQDSQIVEQESNQDFLEADNNLDKDCSSVLQDSDKIADCPKNKSDFFAYVENNVLLEKNINDHNRSVKNNEEHLDNNNQLYAGIMTGEGISNEKCIEASEEPARLKAKDATKKFQCPECKKAFSTSYNYKQHIGIHFTDQQKFHCKDCGVSFAWKSTLNKHIANNHSSDGPQKFVCEICPKIYSTLSQVNVSLSICTEYIVHIVNVTFALRRIT